MDYSYNSWGDNPVWYFLIQFFILAVALLLGNSIRRKVSFIRKSLVPTSLIGGLIILLLKFIPLFDKFVDLQLMEIITYHCLALGFIALSLKKSVENGGKNKTLVKSVVESGLLTGATYVLQAIIGLIVTIILFFVCDFFAGGGVILALGFGQGTGQALNYGKRFELEFGFSGGATFGLTIATVGFFVASVVGVIYMNILRRQGKLKHTEKRKELGDKLSDYVGKNEIPNNESIDKLTMNLILVLFVYALVFVVMKLVNMNLLWGFNFLLGSLFALLTKLVINFFQKKQIIHRDLTNNYLLDRISGFVFDIMIIAGAAAIDIHALSSMWWQILIICTLGTVGTFIYVRLACNQLYPGYEHEGFFAMFGMLTGTASNGVILLREIDPAFETPASSNLVLSSLPAILFGGGLLLLLELCPKGIDEALISLAILIVSGVVYTLILFRKVIFKKKYAKKAEQSNAKE
ncbi:MAG: hypothetical protein IKZ38_02290 [Clostridia bacterium]|nr:hypothetical protein [Clostridia bacterium]